MSEHEHVWQVEWVVFGPGEYVPTLLCRDCDGELSRGAETAALNAQLARLAALEREHEAARVVAETDRCYVLMNDQAAWKRFVEAHADVEAMKADA